MQISLENHQAELIRRRVPTQSFRTKDREFGRKAAIAQELAER
jgi:hypothetical protein